MQYCIRIRVREHSLIAIYLSSKKGILASVSLIRLREREVREVIPARQDSSSLGLGSPTPQSPPGDVDLNPWVSEPLGM